MNKPPCTRDKGKRLSVRAEPRWLAWVRRYARYLNVPMSLLVQKAVEEFAATRGHPELPPRRYVASPFFDEALGLWTDGPPEPVEADGSEVADA